jgi:ribokinase
VAPDVVSVGSLNLDVTIAVESLPRHGETVLGRSSARAVGGKGGNQAAAARAAGAAVAMIARVGADEAGEWLIADLRERGIDASGVLRTRDAPSGQATIAVDAAGENLIIVDPGANLRLTAADVRVPSVAESRILLAQLEIPLPVVVAAAGHATGRVILNPSPPQPLRPELIERTDVLVVNQSELGELAHTDAPAGREAAEAAVRRLGLPCDVIVTLGAAGALVAARGGAAPRAVPAPRVIPVDTTGAGDCFCGILAGRLAAGEELLSAVRLATAGAALSTLAPGARGRLPSESEIRAAADA